MTKQRETRERVLELIEPLQVGDSIPSERQLSVDLSVSRLTVRAALEELVREGYLVRRRGAAFVARAPLQAASNWSSRAAVAECASASIARYSSINFIPKGVNAAPPP